MFLECSTNEKRLSICSRQPFLFLSGERIIVRPTAGVCRCSTLRRHRGREPGAPFEALEVEITFVEVDSVGGSSASENATTHGCSFVVW